MLTETERLKLKQELERAAAGERRRQRFQLAAIIMATLAVLLCFASAIMGSWVFGLGFIGLALSLVALDFSA